MRKKNNIQKITITGLSIALVCVATFTIQIPIPLGYMHFGNIMILLCGFLFPWDIALLAGGVGSALADLISGYPQWILPTLIIKSLMGFAISYMSNHKKKTAKLTDLSTFIAVLLGIVVMIFGYFISGSILYGSIITGAAQIPGLTLEGICGIIGFYIVGIALEKVKIRKYIKMDL